jgi:BirA family transcriptional regulator, biotin operon repressor / biotin---[acetyl-CoA-carboxylase] ligase
MSYPLCIITGSKGRRIIGEPNAIAGTSPLWRADIARFGPWRLTDSEFPTPGFYGKMWISEGPRPNTRIVITGECPSSMDAAWRCVQNHDISSWDSILAVSQTAGRGRQGRVWMSPPGNLHAAWHWPALTRENFADPDWKTMVSLLAGYIIAKALNELSGIDIRLKWPNDLLAGNRKIGGILTEIRSDQVILGIGINIDACPADADLRQGSAVPATHLQREGFDIGPLSLWAALAERGELIFQRLVSALSASEFISVIRPMLAWVGHPVRVISGSDEITGVVAGISPDGGLRLNQDGGDIIIYSGSIVPIENP